jgi:hypothetical protein
LAVIRPLGIEFELSVFNIPSPGRHWIFHRLDFSSLKTGTTLIERSWRQEWRGKLGRLVLLVIPQQVTTRRA